MEYKWKIPIVWVFGIAKSWRISLGHFIKHKCFIFEEWYSDYSDPDKVNGLFAARCRKISLMVNLLILLFFLLHWIGTFFDFVIFTHEKKRPQNLLFLPIISLFNVEKGNYFLSNKDSWNTKNNLRRRRRVVGVLI